MKVGPALSVILPAKNASTIALTLDHLRAQTILASIEVVVVTERKEKLALASRALEGFGSARVVSIGSFKRLSQAVVAGVYAAAAPVVVMAEDHSYPAPDWAEALLRRHQEPWTAVGPAMVCANPDSALGWTDLLLGFGRWVERDRPGEVDGLPGHNSSYKRDVLLGYGRELENLVEIENLLQADLHRRGHRFYFEPAARTRHVNITRPSSWISNRFFGGWVFGVLRSRGWSRKRRVIYVMGGPLLPAVRLIRLVPDLRRIGSRHRLLPRVLPALVAAVIIESLGETLGYLFGRRVRIDRPLDVEIDRARHLRTAQRVRRAHARSRSAGDCGSSAQVGALDFGEGAIGNQQTSLEQQSPLA